MYARTRPKCFERRGVEPQRLLGVLESVLVSFQLETVNEPGEKHRRKVTDLDKCRSAVGEEDRADLASLTFLRTVADAL